VIALYAFDHELARARRVTSNPLMAEIRITWWSEALDEIYEGRSVRRHPVAQALAMAVARAGLPRDPLEAALDARSEGDEPAAAGAIAEAAALLLEGSTDREAARIAGRAWREGVTAEVRLASARLSAATFPAVAHAGLRPGGELARRARLTWTVMRGRL
jgi:phytoene synthase